MGWLFAREAHGQGYASEAAAAALAWADEALKRARDRRDHRCRNTRLDPGRGEMRLRRTRARDLSRRADPAVQKAASAAVLNLPPFRGGVADDARAEPARDVGIDPAADLIRAMGSVGAVVGVIGRAGLAAGAALELLPLAVPEGSAKAGAAASKTPQNATT